MPNSNNQKIALVIATGFLLQLASPAQAEAPQMSHKMFQMQKALQNPKQYAKTAIKAYGWSQTQFVCLTRLWGKESAWNYKADNPISTAYGIAQILGETAKHPMLQINNGLRYIKHRYGTPCTAWQYWQRHYWY